MVGFLGKRMLWSAGSLIDLVILVFFMARLTGSPADLYLPIGHRRSGGMAAERCV